MSFGDTAEIGVMRLLFQAVTFAEYAENDTTTPETDLGVALHTSTGPAEAGSQTTLEAAYGGYVRVDVVRSAGGWAEASGVVTPVANIDFVEAASGTETETFFSVGKASNSDLLCFGAIAPTIAVVTGVTPRLTTATTITLT